MPHATPRQPGVGWPEPVPGGAAGAAVSCRSRPLGARDQSWLGLSSVPCRTGPCVRGVPINAWPSKHGTVAEIAPARALQGRLTIDVQALETESRCYCALVCAWCAVAWSDRPNTANGRDRCRARVAEEGRRSQRVEECWRFARLLLHVDAPKYYAYFFSKCMALLLKI